MMNVVLSLINRNKSKKKFLFLYFLWIMPYALFADDIYFIGVSGGSGSGKSTLTKKIQEAFLDDIVVIEQDAYYKDLSHLSEHEREFVNFDHPAAIDFDLLVSHLYALKSDNSIDKPIYDFKTHTRMTQSVHVEPRRMVLVEGILIFSVPELRELLDLKIYVDNQEDIRLLRRIERDMNERGRDFQSVKNQYLTTVKPMHARYVEPTKWLSDVIIPSAGSNEVSLDLIISKLKSY